MELAEEAEGNDDVVAIKDFSTPLAAGANKEDTEDAEGKAESDVVEIIGGAEALGDSDVMEVTWGVKRSEAIEGVEGAAAEQ